jgi:hypothetical protein
VLIFKEGIEREKDRVQGALRAAVAAGRADPVRVWPEYFAKPDDDEESFPTAGADMSGFKWEAPTAEQVAAELEQMMHGARVSMRDGQVAAPPPPREPEARLRPGNPRLRRPPADASELEWG